MDSHSTVPPPQLRLATWIGRYGPQELAATLATLAWCWGVARGAEPDPGLGVAAAAVELSVYYAVALLRHRSLARAGTSWSSCLRAIASEYGPAELLDIVVRTGLMGLGARLSAAPATGILLGSLCADVVFYRVVSACAQDARFVRASK